MPASSPGSRPSAPSRLAQSALKDQELQLFVLATAVGVLGGLAAVALRFWIEGIAAAAYGGDSPMEGVQSGVRPVWLLVLLPALGALASGLMGHFWAHEARGHGVPEIVRAIQLKGGVMPARVPLAKFLTAGLTIGMGGSAGREGPIAQIGAGLGSLIGQRLRLSREHLRVLVAAGTAAGIAGAFNAPIGGAFFALEIVLGTFAARHFAPIVVASTAGTVVVREILGDGHVFPIPPHSLVHPLELAVYAGLGLLAAVVAVSFTRALVISEEVAERLPVPGWLRPGLGGLGVGLLALAVPAVLGSGNDVLSHILSGERAWTLGPLLLLLVAKVVATCLTLGSGGSGGVFLPSLFLGAVLGAAVGQIAGLTMPFPTAPFGAYALVGMAAVAAGTTHAPATQVLMIFELTGDYRIMAPLLVSVALATVLAYRLLPDSIYTHKLSRLGVRLRQGPQASLLMHELQVDDVMRTGEAETVAPAAPLRDVVACFLRSRALHVYVTEEERYRGTVHLQDVKHAFGDAVSEKLALAADVLAVGVPTVRRETPLLEALETMHLAHLDELPVLEDREGGDPVLVGSVSEHDILAVYNQEMLRKQALLARFVTQPEDGRLHEDYYELPLGHQLAQVPVPPALVGKTLLQAAIRHAYGLNVLAIKLRDADGEWAKRVPDPDYVLRAEDRLVVMGPEQGVQALRNAGTPDPTVQPEAPRPEPASGAGPAAS